jgi:hypothetical protein
VSVVNTRTARIEVVEDRIVVARIGDEVQSVDDARETLDACLRFAEPDRKALLCDIRVAKPMTPEVRHIYTGGRFDAFGAMALLVSGTPLGRTRGSVYFKIARLAIPTKVFVQEQRALTWLREAR